MCPFRSLFKTKTLKKLEKSQTFSVRFEEIYLFFFRLHGGDNVQIKRYFVSFWNGVDLRYKLLKGPKIRITIAGIIISRVCIGLKRIWNRHFL